MKNIVITSFASCLVFLASCSKKHDNPVIPKEIPVLNTSPVTLIGVTSASTGGNITNDGGSAVTTRGMVWSTASNPSTTLNTKCADGIGTGNFTSNIIGLTFNTTYYVRAYATNGVGTAYGNEISFKTADATSATNVAIGNQVWKTKNLDVSTYRNGDVIPQITDMAAWAALKTGAWCYYNNDSSNNTIYGKLYNWYAINDVRGLAPMGWHIPSKEEWAGLIFFLGGDSLAGGKMKATTLWNSPNTGATNTSGFTGFPGGYRKEYGAFDFAGTSGYWWFSKEHDSISAVERSLGFDYVDCYIYFYDKRYGISVRCIQD